jgi:hypothetical protein
MKKILLIIGLLGCVGLTALNETDIYSKPEFLGVETDEQFLWFRCEMIEMSVNRLDEMVKTLCPFDPMKNQMENEIEILKFMIGE